MSAVATLQRVPRAVYWVVLVASIGAISLLPPDVHERMIALLVGVFVIAWAATRPAHALVGIVVLIPIQPHLLAFVYRVGVPGQLVRGAGQIKEALLIGVVLAALRIGARDRHSLDGLDRAALAFLGVVAGYLVLPLLLEPVAGRLFPNAPSDWYSLGVAARSDAGLVVVLLAARSIPLSDAWRRRVLHSVVAIASVVALGGLVEFFLNDLWQQFERTIQFARYHVEVLDFGTPPAKVTSVIGGREFLRAGSTMSQLTLGFFLLSGIAVQLSRASQRVRWVSPVLLGIMTIGVVVTLTRSAVLALVVAVVVSTALARTSDVSSRTRLVVVAAVGLVVLASVSDATGLMDRAFAAIRGQDDSATLHGERSSDAIETILARPMGVGLGSQPNVEHRTTGVASVVAENAFLALAVEIGIVSGLLFVWMLWRLLVSLTRRRGEDPVAPAAAGAVAGLIVGGLFLHVWTDLVVTWTLMIVCGISLPRRSPTVEPHETGAQPVGASMSSPADRASLHARRRPRVEPR